MGDGQGFEINPAGVTEFGAKLQSDVDKDIAPMTERIKNDLTYFPVFGVASGSPAVQDAARLYVGQINAGLTLLDTLIRNAGAMARAATDVVNAYKAGDDLSAAEMQAVIGGASKTVNDAADAALLAKQEAERRALEDERKFLHQHGMR